MAAYKDEQRGTWYVSFHYYDWTGKNCRKVKRGFKTKREATELERHFRMKEAADLDMTFEEFVQAYTRDMKPKLKHNTWLTKEHILRTKLLPYFKDKKMRDIRPKDIIQWQNEQISYRDEKGKPYAPTYLKTLQSELSALFNHAVRFYELKSNPVVKAGPLGKGKAEEMLFWTKEEYLSHLFRGMTLSPIFPTEKDKIVYERHDIDKKLLEYINELKCKKGYKLLNQLESEVFVSSLHERYKMNTESALSMFIKEDLFSAWEVSKRKKNYLCRAEKRWSRLQEMSENGADVSWDDVGKVLEDERSSVEDIQADLVRNNKGNICQSIDNCMTVFQRDPLLKGTIRKNELSGEIDIVGDLGWERTSSSLTDTDVYQLHWYLEKQYGLKNERNINKAMNIAASENRYHPIREYLEQFVWDGKYRIGRLLLKCLGAEEDAYTREIMQLTV